jgi:hypothetical protein
MEDFVGLIYKSITFKPQMEDFIVIKPLFVGDVQLPRLIVVVYPLKLTTLQDTGTP